MLALDTDRDHSIEGLIYLGSFKSAGYCAAGVDHRSAHNEEHISGIS